MNTTYNPKKKLTITVDEKILERSKKKCKEKHLTLAGIIENFLNFFVSPWVYCFGCGDKFYVEEGGLCAKCGWLKCPRCGICRCELDEKVAVAVFHMRRVYEDILMGRIK